jgi:predicted O-methyltransferase YrrM
LFFIPFHYHEELPVQNQWTSVDHFYSEKLGTEDQILRDTLLSNSKAGLPAIDVSANQGKLLQFLAQMIGARRILEVGTLGGYSTIHMARSLPKGGKLITMEFDAKHAEVAKANIAHADLSSLVEIRLGDANDLLPKLYSEKPEPFDLVFLDADKKSNPAYFEWALKMTKSGSLIIVDNVVRGGAILESESNDPHIQGVRQLATLVGKEKRVQATAVQTVGTKGYDGFLIARVL